MRRLSIVLLLLVLLAAACSGGDPEIARVGDTPIYLSEIQALYVEEQPIDDGFRQSLFSVMAVEAATQALAAEYGVTADPAAVADYETQLGDAITEQQVTPAILFRIPNVGGGMVSFQARVWALKDAAVDALTLDPEVVDELFANPAVITAVCVKHILVSTEEQAEDVMARLAAGQDFAALAEEVSLDTNAQGGDLGCNPASYFVVPFAEAAMEAPVGEVYGPVQTTFGFHVLIVGQRTVPTREQFLLGPRLVLSDDQLTAIWEDWLKEVIAAADAWVAEDYGTWTPAGIQPTASEGATTTTAPTTTSAG